MILEELSPVIQSATGYTPFYWVLPDRPDTAIALIPGPSPDAVDAFGQVLPLYRRVRVQVLCRSRTSSTALLLAEQVYQYVQAIVNGEVNQTYYLQLAPVGEPYAVGRDMNNRLSVSLNLEAWKESSVIA